MLPRLAIAGRRAPGYRDGGQAQYIDTPLPEPGEDLAWRSAMSRRTFARRFAASTGTAPYHWLPRQWL